MALSVMRQFTWSRVQTWDMAVRPILLESVRMNTFSLLPTAREETSARSMSEQVTPVSGEMPSTPRKVLEKLMSSSPHHGEAALVQEAAGEKGVGRTGFNACGGLFGDGGFDFVVDAQAVGDFIFAAEHRVAVGLSMNPWLWRYSRSCRTVTPLTPRVWMRCFTRISFCSARRLRMVRCRSFINAAAPRPGACGWVADNTE